MANLSRVALKVIKNGVHVWHVGRLFYVNYASDKAADDVASSVFGVKSTWVECSS